MRSCCFAESLMRTPRLNVFISPLYDVRNWILADDDVTVCASGDAKCFPLRNWWFVWKHMRSTGAICWQQECSPLICARSATQTCTHAWHH